MSINLGVSSKRSVLFSLFLALILLTPKAVAGKFGGEFRGAACTHALKSVFV